MAASASSFTPQLYLKDSSPYGTPYADWIKKRWHWLLKSNKNPNRSNLSRYNIPKFTNVFNTDATALGLDNNLLDLSFHAPSEPHPPINPPSTIPIEDGNCIDRGNFCLLRYHLQNKNNGVVTTPFKPLYLPLINPSSRVF